MKKRPFGKSKLLLIEAQTEQGQAPIMEKLEFYQMINRNATLTKSRAEFGTLLNSRHWS